MTDQQQPPAQPEQTPDPGTLLSTPPATARKVEADEKPVKGWRLPKLVVILGAIVILAIGLVGGFGLSALIGGGPGSPGGPGGPGNGRMGTMPSGMPDMSGAPQGGGQGGLGGSSDSGSSDSGSSDSE